MAKIYVKAEAYDSTKTIIQAGRHQVIIDEPPLFGGEDAAPSPVEMYLSSIAGCINAIGQWAAKEIKNKIKKLEIEIEGEIYGERFLRNDLSHRAGFEKIEVQIRLESDADEKQLKEWEQAVNFRCPVTDNTLYHTELILKKIINIS